MTTTFSYRVFAIQLATTYHATKTPAARRRVAGVISQWKAKILTTTEAIDRLTTAVLGSGKTSLLPRQHRDRSSHSTFHGCRPMGIPASNW